MNRVACVWLALWAMAAVAQEAPDLRYQPDPAVTLDSAVRAMQRLDIKPAEVTMDRYPYGHTFSASRPQLSFTARLYRIDFVHGAGADPAAPRAIAYDEMTRLGMVSDFGFRATSIDGKWYIWCVRIVDSDRREACAKALADYFQALKARAEFLRQSDARFQEVLAKHREPGSRPELSEEARRHKVQAELAVERKRFADAANAYVMAVRAAPWWAEGYYNLGLIKGELKDYEDAARMMKRFLALEPQSPHARAAQDQVYRWEALDAEK